MKITIVISYFERFFQLCKTLESIRTFTDCDIIVVDDGSEIPLNIPDGEGIEVLRMKDKDWTLHSIALNRGIQKALKSDAILVQCAECMHTGDIIRYIERFLTPRDYFSFACYSLDQKNTFGGWDKKTLDRGCLKNGENGWYNHKEYRPNYYDFCAVTTTKNWKKLNGYDERYAYGHAMGDEDLIQRIKLLKLKQRIVSYPYVVHQWHYSNNYTEPNGKLYKRNQNLIKKISGYKAKHLKTKDF